ncbi:MULTISPECIES: PadR family transcriptional regulator [unclassified Salinivibrio]|uniref:PadR family transcriptional regulator n=1 Tax=unclassified Salinivibrio TaxID=2636825 RepID=UPI0009893D78|nr:MULTISPECIES: PadR family transcriptional regulator [unclassified Salinivibrio]NUY55293.1 PadR family transcriptional regulator [Salinivibrio sp. EAGSL]OOE97588.1 transcriptional regulator [Salinivibrio sp. IB643]
MSLPHVILTVLSNCEATGYDITKAFSTTISNVWKASHQQVYRELTKLAERGAVTYRLEPQVGKPDRKVYAITPVGTEVLEAWFIQAPKLAPPRDEYVARLLSCEVLDPTPMLEHINNLIAESQQLLNHYALLEQRDYGQSTSLTQQQRLMRLALRRSIHQRRAWMAWAQEVRDELTMLAASA